MTDLNHVTLIGRVTQDITDNNFGYIGNGTAKMNISIAVNRSVKKAETWENEASFFNITVWGKQAEALKNLIHKGKQIAVEGALHQERWEKDGVKHSNISIIASSIQLLGAKTETSADSPAKVEAKAGFVPKEVNFLANEFQGTVTPVNPASSEFPEDIPF